MNKRRVWHKIKRSQIPSDRRWCVKSKWVFKIKRNGVYRARLVACGYSQIPGVDFSENYLPVVNDITYRLLIIAMIIFHLSAKIVDVETAFLYGDLDEKIFMECPPGMSEVYAGQENISSDDVLELGKCIYGLVQAARQYFKKAVATLKKIGFEGGEVDPCLMVLKTRKGICYIALYVDDNLLVGTPEAIDEVIAALKGEGLILKIEDDLHDYLSCEIVFSSDRSKAWLGQPHLISNLESKFGPRVMDLRTYKTAGTPGFRTIRPSDDTEKISNSDQSLYCSGVGMLLYLVKHSRPDIANATRELSKVLDGATPSSFKEMHRVIKYVLDTKTKGLKIEPSVKKDEPWKLVLFCNSDYAGDPESRRSVSGYILYVCDVPVCWRSKAQRSVTLSSTEAEYVALSEAVKEILFVLQILECMRITVTLPVIVRVDNVGAIFMSKNVTTTSRTKHVDVRYKYVNEYVEDGVIKILFVKSEDNEADGMTKNLGGEQYEKHNARMICDRPSF